jgi:outer membrane protein insertion porin family
VVEGQLIAGDRAESVRAALEGGADEKRIRRILDTLGYKVAVEQRPGKLVLRLSPHRVIRKIYIKGNWPIFEEEILRRLRFRPGQRLPEGKELAVAIARQEEQMTGFLRREGYFESGLSIKVTPADMPQRVNLEVRLTKERWWERHKVGDVVVRRLRRGRGAEAPQQKPALTDGEIAKFFRHRILFYRRPFDTVQFKKDVEALLRRHQELGYPGARIKEGFEVLPSVPRDRAVRITLDISQRKHIEARFQGNGNLSDKELRKSLTFIEEGAYDDYAASQSARAIHRRYQSEGYLQARVRVARKVGPTSDQITFTIEEGPRVRVASVTFAGNSSLKDDELHKVIKTRTFPWLGYFSLGEGGYITDTQLQQDVERIVAQYREQGFTEVNVRAEVAPHRDLLGQPGALAAAVAAGAAEGGKVHVRFTIQEGKRVVVERVYLEGNKLIDSAKLLAQLQLKPNRPFTEKALAMDKARLARIYSENGHPYAAVRAFEEMSADGTRETVQFSVEENKRVRFGPIFLRGNVKTRQRIILSDLKFRQGDAFDIRLIEAAEARMRKRQIFNAVSIQLLGIADEHAELPVVVTVEERYDDHGAIEFGVGGSTDNLFFGSVAYTNSNLFGFGTALTLKLEAGMKIQSFNGLYRDTRLFGSTLVLDVEGFVRNQLTSRLGELFTLGGAATFTKELVPNLKATLRYEFRRITHREDVIRPAGVDEQRQVDILTQTAAITPGLVYERRDNPLNPTRGFRIGASVAAATRYLGGLDDFLKLNVSGQAFIPLPKDMTIALSARYDHGFPLGGDVVLPKVERFYAGGDTTIRGFEEDWALAERIELPAAPLGGATLYKLRPQGGNIRLLSNLEFQFPIWRESIVFGLPLMGAVFMDNGVVTNSFTGFNVRDFRHGAGLALRIVTPVGSSSFEYAWPLDPDLGDPQTGRFHFNFGFVF